ncbi:MAG: hypothetical protein ABII01_07320 [Candidatus Woesearchaeota archaeon]
MAYTDLSDLTILGTGIMDWFRQFKTPQKTDYGLEFLTAATEEFLDIPNRERYPLPQGVRGRHFEDTINRNVMKDDNIPANKKRRKSYQRINAIRKNWEQGSRPYSIRSMDYLRDPANGIFQIDLLNPVSYDGTYLENDGIPFSHPFVPQLSYLVATRLVGGSFVNRNVHVGIVDQDQMDKLKRKLTGPITNGYTEFRPDLGNVLQIKGCYLHVFDMLGLVRGKTVDATPKNLGVGYLEEVIELMKLGNLDRHDHNHAQRIVTRFMEGLIDHKLVKGDSSTVVINPVGFRYRRTSEHFTQFLRNAFGAAFPDIPFSMPSPDTRSRQLYDGEWRNYYGTRIHISSRHRDDFYKQLRRLD